MLNRQEIKKIPKAGEQAPQFVSQMVDGSSFDLWQVSDTTTVYLSFLRYTSCPVCNYRIHELMENYDELRANGVFPIIVFESETSDLEKYISYYKIPIPIIADPESKLYDLYEVEDNVVKTLISSGSDGLEEQFQLGNDLFYDDAPIEEEGNTSRLPADFVIRNGKFLKSKFGKHIGDHLPISDILVFSNI